MKTSAPLATLLLATALNVFAVSAQAAPAANGPDNLSPQQIDWQAKRAEDVDAHISRMATLLQLNEAQKNSDVWKLYGQAVRQLANHKTDMPDNRATSATMLMRSRADAAAKFASKLSTLADATRKLEDSLTPAQRAAFDSLAQQQNRMHAGPSPMHHGSPQE